MKTIDAVEAVWLAILIPGFAYTVFALWGARRDEQAQRTGWTDKEGKHYAPVNGDVLRAAQSRLEAYIALLAAQGFMMIIGVLAAMTGSAAGRVRTWGEWAFILGCMGLDGITTAATVSSHRKWQKVIANRNARLAKVEQAKAPL